MIILRLTFARDADCDPLMGTPLAAAGEGKSVGKFL